MNRAFALLLVLPLGLIHAADSPPSTAPAPASGSASNRTPETAFESYRAELHRFRQAFGGARDLPGKRFFLFGMGRRQRLATPHTWHSAEVFLYLLDRATSGSNQKTDRKENTR